MLEKNDDPALRHAGSYAMTLLMEPRQIAALSDYDDARADASILSAGADGVVHKASLATDLYSAVDAVLAGRRFISPPSTH